MARESPGSRPWRAAPSGNCPDRQAGWRRGHRARARGWPAGSRRARRWPAGRGPATRRFGDVLGRRRGRPAAGSAAPGTGRRRHRTRPDCPGRPSTCMPPSRPCIIGRPGRSATRQNDSSRPSAARARCTRSCSPTEAPPVVTRTSAPQSRARRTAADVLDAIMRNAEVDHLAPSLRAKRHQRKAVGIDDLARRGLAAGRHQLVAGAEHRDLGPPVHAAGAGSSWRRPASGRGR